MPGVGLARGETPRSRWALRRPRSGLPAPVLFVCGGMAQCAGSALAVLLYARIAPSGVALLRVLSAAVVMALWSRPWRVAWTVRQVRLVAAFGVVLAGMNLCFLLALERLPLGMVVAIEFSGPVLVAALGSRTRSDMTAIALAGGGVVLLSGVRVGGDLAGVALALGAATAWALYIVLGHRVAADPALDAQRGLAGAMLVAALVLLPLGTPAAAVALPDPALLTAAIGVGLLASVVPYSLEQIALARLTRARFALLLSLMPATATVVGLVVLGQVPGLAEAAGIGLVVVAAALSGRHG